MSAIRSHHRYYDLILAAFVVVLLCSNFIGAGKAAVIDLPYFGPVIFGAGILFFPISYFFGDILTEVYGYAYDRRAVWAGFAALAFAAIMAQIVIALPVAPGEYMAQYQQGMVSVFGNSWRIALASMLAFWCGSFVNSYVLAKLKIWTQGRFLWVRTIGSTAFGELVDSSLFYVLAFYGIWPIQELIQVALVQYVLKTSWEVLATPLTYWVVGALKRKESVDHYDIHTNFTPFRVKV
ncbi:MAG: queuosine precursor transporter [Betaproteobacteria bacterium]|jgi:queuosine precursor transporter|uniref:queuosine precursor transporter n=1 Tax=Polynucleobacter finlandensis TaxID=1855894 RepID=UPI001C0AE869|nr:queuosine precursor transporter [Polynucleobacter finlandensis]MBU3544206.1 queuosine precursor transporter [Polynucleobacter finlandensis]